MFQSLPIKKEKSVKKKQLIIDVPETTIDTAGIELLLKRILLKTQDVNVNVDMAEVKSALLELKRVIEANKPVVHVEKEAPVVNVDMKAVENAVNRLQESIKQVSVEDMRAIMSDAIGTLFGRKARDYVNVRLTNGKDFYNAVSTAISNASRIVEIGDGDGNKVSITNGKLDVNATASLAGETLPISGATEAVGVALVDENGDQISGSNPLAVSATIDTTGLATSAKQDTIIGHIDGVENELTTLNAKDFATETSLATLAGKDFATEVTLQAVNADTTAIKNAVEGTLDVDTGLTQPLTDAQLRASAVPVSATNLDIRPLVNTDVITAELSATDNAVLDTIAAKDFATQTTLAAIKDTDGIKKITDNVNVNAHAVYAQAWNGTSYGDLQTTAGGDLKITLDGESVPVTATNLDVRDLAFATDKVDVSGSTLGANSGVDVGDVTINNAAGASAVNIQDGGNTITVDGAVTVTNATATNLKAEVVGTGTFATQVTSIAAGDNNIGNVDVVTMPSITGTVTANAGTNLNTSALALETGGNLAAAATSLGLLDNSVDGNYLNVNMNVAGTDVVSGSGTATGALRVELPTNGTGVVGLNAGTNLVGKVSSADRTDAIYNDTTALTPKFAAIDVASSGNNTIIAAVTSKKIRVLSLFLVSAGTVNVRFESGADGTALSGQMNLIANTGFVLPYNPVGWFESASGVLLNLELSGAVSVDGSLTYIEV